MKKLIITFVIVYLAGNPAGAQESPSKISVYPKEIFDVLNNPGIGFTTFQRFNGDALNPGSGWTEGLPIAYQEFNGDLTNKSHPQTTIAYFRVDWSFLETEQGKYNWPMIDKALRTAAERGQTLMFRVAPYEQDDRDVPAWYRQMVGKEKKEKSARWRVDPEDPRYLQYFGGLIAALGQRYDGHPDLESVDMSIVGFWGEGADSELLSDSTRIALINCYLDNFKKTPLNFLPITGSLHSYRMVEGTNIAASWMDGRNNGEGAQMRHVGFRVDCLGDISTELWKKEGWSHMRDLYPRDIIKSGMADAWKKAPVTFEICWTFLMWLEKFKYDVETVEYIFGEALKWHISSFNAKSSPVPEVWSPLVDKWLNRMGYRYIVRKFEYPSFVYRQGQLSFSSLWENVGVAPVYKEYLFAVRLRNEQKTIVLPTAANIRDWLPGDILYEENLYIPLDAPAGKYRVELAIVSPVTYEPRIQIAIDGKTDDGWYFLGDVEIKENDLKDR